MEQDLLRQLVGGGLIVSMGTILLSWAKSLPIKVFEGILRNTTTTMTATQNDEEYQTLSAWVHNRKGRTWTRGAFGPVVDRSEHYDNIPECDRRRKVVAIVAGKSMFFCRKRLFVATFSTKELQLTKEASDASMEFRMSLDIFPRSRRVLEEVLVEAKASYVSGYGDKTMVYFLQRYSQFSKPMSKPKRSMTSVCARDGVLDDVVSDAKDFLARKRWYQDNGIPWHRGYMFYGPPGNGKTSTVLVLANELNTSVYVLSLSGISSDSELIHAINQIPSGSIVVIEDLDAFSCAIKRKDAVRRRSRRGQAAPQANGDFIVETGDRYSVTMSGLLNVMDGFGSKDGIIMVVTTNRPEVIDAAVFRPGRIDRSWYFGDCDDSQAERMMRKFFPDASEADLRSFVSKAGGEQYSASCLQRHLMSKSSTRSVLDDEIVPDHLIEPSKVIEEPDLEAEA